MPEPGLYCRASLRDQLEEEKAWDIAIIGGGATGLGVALDAATRGLRTVLFEQFDFAKGTSSRSTKLIHGGVRYLAQGDIKLVYSALHEREILRRNAPHIVKSQSFIIPCYSIWSIIKYSVGLRVYDLLAGAFSLGRSNFISRRNITSRLRNINLKDLKGGVEYFDGQFDDARLAIALAQSAVDAGGVVLNYFKVSALTKENDKVNGLLVEDTETQKSYEVRAGVVINATGVFVDDILKMDNPSSTKLVRPSQGVHVVVDKKFLGGESAMLIPETSDGRVLFAVPWKDHVIVGTTDTPLDSSSVEPVPLDSEVAFILETIGPYLEKPPAKHDVLSTFAGLRPLAASSSATQQTKELSRDHKLFRSESGMITITGGKWTTYRKMAEETVDLAVKTMGKKRIKCATKNAHLHGSRTPVKSNLSIYGTDEELIIGLAGEKPELDTPLINGYTYTLAEVVWGIRHEMARTIEDVLARRLRLLFLDAGAAIAAAPRVAEIFQSEHGWTDEQKKVHLEEFFKIAYHYKLNT